MGVVNGFRALLLAVFARLRPAACLGPEQSWGLIGDLCGCLGTELTPQALGSPPQPHPHSYTPHPHLALLHRLYFKMFTDNNGVQPQKADRNFLTIAVLCTVGVVPGAMRRVLRALGLFAKYLWGRLGRQDPGASRTPFPERMRTLIQSAPFTMG